MAEEDLEMAKPKCTLSVESCDDFNAPELDKLLSSFADGFSDIPGMYNVGSCEIVLNSNSHVVNLPPHRVL